MSRIVDISPHGRAGGAVSEGTFEKARDLKWFLVKEPDQSLVCDEDTLVDYLLSTPWAGGWTIADSTGERRVRILNPYYPWSYREWWTCRNASIEDIPVDVARIEFLRGSDDTAELVE
jgi:hypothetical protein